MFMFAHTCKRMQTIWIITKYIKSCVHLQAHIYYGKTECKIHIFVSVHNVNFATEFTMLILLNCKSNL